MGYPSLSTSLHVFQSHYTFQAISFPSPFVLSISELWWSNNTANIFNLIILVEGHLILPFLFFIFLCSSTGMILLSFVFYHYQQCSCPNLGFPFGFLVFFNSSSYLCCFLLMFFFFFFWVGGKGLHIYFSSIVLEITILRFKIRVLVLGFGCQNPKFLVFDLG